MGNLWIFVIILPVATLISYFWVRGIEYMDKNHPNYKGEDFLSWDDEDKNHTESEF